MIPQVQYGNLGAVFAQADFAANTITLNRELWHILPAKLREYIMCHELTHLHDGLVDEAETNRRAAQRYISRATSKADRQARAAYVAEMRGVNFSWTDLAPHTTHKSNKVTICVAVSLLILILFKK